MHDKKQQGFTLIELLIVMLIVAAAIPTLASLLTLSTTTTAQKVAAEQLKLYRKAAQEYVTANYSTLESTATAANAVSVSTATLISGGYLPSTFQTRNPWNQLTTLYITQPNSGDLQALVVTSGGRGHDASNPAFGDKTIPYTAAMAGAFGGFFPTGDISGQTAGVVQGAYGGWQFALAGTDIPNPGAGHLAALAYFSSGTLSSDYLYRVSVPGHDELNTMQTTLYMGGNTISMGDGDIGGGDTEGIGSLNFEEHVYSDYTCAAGDDTGGTVHFDPDEGLYICRDGLKEVIADSGNSGLFQTATIADTGDVIAKPTCPSGAVSNPEIYTVPVMYHDDSYQLLRGVQAWATDLGTDWQVHLQVLTGAGWTTPTTTAKIQVITRCAD